MTAEENDAAMQIAFQKYSTLVVPGPEQLKKKEPEPPKKRKSKLELLDEKAAAQENDFKRLEDKQAEFTKKLQAGDKDISDDQLKEHALDLQILYTEQEALTKGLEDAINIVTDYLEQDGRQALIKFFQV